MKSPLCFHIEDMLPGETVEAHRLSHTHAIEPTQLQIETHHRWSLRHIGGYFATSSCVPASQLAVPPTLPGICNIF